jgi:2-polyprenyl-3-methyl-5-hydroxy-6-metoxy-1,4-benzoquinol methylase
VRDSGNVTSDIRPWPMNVQDFVAAHLPQPPARVLEVGCGAGHLARRLAELGNDVTAIDPDAPEGAIFRKVSLEDFAEPGLFDAVVASRSLHHVPDVTAALTKIHDLLRAGGLLILNEFAWDQLNEVTARWYLAHVPEPASTSGFGTGSIRCSGRERKHEALRAEESWTLRNRP